MKEYLGIEFGSTRIKGVLIDERGEVKASGVHNWVNKFSDGYWTYGKDDILKGLQNTYLSLKKDYKEKYGKVIKTVSAIGISGMMHGYIALDKDGEMLVPFRTWRNVNTSAAANTLTENLNFNIPLRWSAAHYYQAVKDCEPHVDKIEKLCTLSVYIHYLLTGKFVAGACEASGMFPVNLAITDYDKIKAATADGLFTTRKKITDILPEILVAGDCAGRLTKRGARILDPESDLEPGAIFCPPEGDAATGMVATGSIKANTGNISAGTSVFMMAVTDEFVNDSNRIVESITTPDGKPVMMVHCNNCSDDLNAWANVLYTENVYENLISDAVKGSVDCGGVVTCNYISGEHITSCGSGVPLVARTKAGDFGKSDFARSLVYSCFATLRLGIDCVGRKKFEIITAHGGLFKTGDFAAKVLSAALKIPVIVYETAGEGGAWGIALLAAFTESGEKNLEKFIDIFFTERKKRMITADDKMISGYDEYIKNFKKLLSAEKNMIKKVPYFY